MPSIQLTSRVFLNHNLTFRCENHSSGLYYNNIGPNNHRYLIQSINTLPLSNPTFCIKLSFPIVSISHLVLFFYLSLSNERICIPCSGRGYIANFNLPRIHVYCQNLTSALLFLAF